MNFQKFFLYGLLALIVFLLWTDWIKEQTALSQHTSTLSAETSPAKRTALVEAKTAIQQIEKEVPNNRLIHVKTDVYDLWIDKQGGNLVRVDLSKYSVNRENKDAVRLLDDASNNLYIMQTGLMSQLGPDKTNAQVIYQTEKDNYILQSNQKTLTVNLNWKNEEGLVIQKQYIFDAGKYLFDVKYTITNGLNKIWEGNLYTEIIKKRIEKSSSGLFNISSYEGPAISSPDKHYEKISFKDLGRKPLDKEITDGWLAMQQHYFVSAIIPDKTEKFHYYSDVTDTDLYTLGALSPTISIPPRSEKNVSFKIYVGPELEEQLSLASPTLKLTIDYGWLWFISEAIFWFMKYVYEWIGNWGWAIIIVTLSIKILFYRLSASSYRSMANMKKLQPKLQALKERYAEDRMRFNQAVLELYKKEKVNPLGGCLPVLIQIPVFIALYWVLIESVQLRQAPFIGWIQDLSVRDPYFVLPILMGITMFVQQKLNPPPPDPVQAKVMMALPIVFTFLFLYFPAGLVLYWVVNNTLSIAQQWYITSHFVKEPARKKR